MSLPAPEYYYNFTYGNAEFFILDSNKECGPGSPQWNWLAPSARTEQGGLEIRVLSSPVVLFR